MSSQHKHPPISLRLPEADRAWLLGYAEHTGIPVNRILTDALTVFRADLAQHEDCDTASPANSWRPQHESDGGLRDVDHRREVRGLLG